MAEPSVERKRAINLLDHYITSIMMEAGMKVDSDTHAEIEELVDHIIDATCREVQHRIIEGIRRGVFKDL